MVHICFPSIAILASLVGLTRRTPLFLGWMIVFQLTQWDEVDPQMNCLVAISRESQMPWRSHMFCMTYVRIKLRTYLQSVTRPSLLRSFDFQPAQRSFTLSRINEKWFFLTLPLIIGKPKYLPISWVYIGNPKYSKFLSFPSRNILRHNEMRLLMINSKTKSFTK